MFRDVWLVAIRDAASVTQMMQLVLPHVIRETLLIAGGFQTDVADMMTLAQVNHESESRWETRHRAEAATVSQIHVWRVNPGTQMAEQLAITVERRLAHYANQDGLLMHLPIVEIQFLVYRRVESAVKAFVDQHRRHVVRATHAGVRVQVEVT